MHFGNRKIPLSDYWDPMMSAERVESSLAACRDREGKDISINLSKRGSDKFVSPRACPELSDQLTTFCNSANV